MPETEKMTIKVGIDVSQGMREIDGILAKARAARELLMMVEKTPVGVLCELCRELLTYLPDEDGGRYSFVWSQCSADEKEEIQAIRDKATTIIGAMTEPRPAKRETARG